MGHRKIIASDEKIPAMTTYIPQKLKVAEQAVAKKFGVSLSARIRKIMEDDVKVNLGGEVKPDFDYEDKKKVRIALKKREKELEKMLQSEYLERAKRNAYEVLAGFAVSLGTDGTLTKNIDKVLVQLHHYEVQDGDPFNGSTLETFIDYIEVVLERRAIEAELKEHRCQVTESLS
jgi:hypothetical protein